MVRRTTMIEKRKKTQWNMPQVLHDFIEKLNNEDTTGVKRSREDLEVEDDDYEYVNEKTGRNNRRREDEAIGDGDADFGEDDEEDGRSGAVTDTEDHKKGKEANLHTEAEHVLMEDDFDLLQRTGKRRMPLLRSRSRRKSRGLCNRVKARAVPLKLRR